MKPHLRLMGGMRLDRKRSAESCQQSALSYQSPPKFQFKSKKELSAVDNQRSALNAYLGVISNLIPKTQYLIPILLLVFVSCGAALAQEPVGHTAPAAKAEAEITPLKVGDRVPDELWEMYFPVVSANSDQVQYLSLGDFKDKLIILDFWATWCAPCISSLHKLDTLQKQFKEDLMVIPTSYEPESKVRSFLENRHINLSSLIDETQLKKYFPHMSIPHQVWLKDNKVLAIAGPLYANPDNITKVINSIKPQILQKEDLYFDKSKPILIDGNGGSSSQIEFGSLLSGRIKTNTSGIQPIHDIGVKLYNSLIPDLFFQAYKDLIGNSSKRMIIEVSDSLKNEMFGIGHELKGEYNNDLKYYGWADKNVYCYELFSNHPIGKDEISQIMRTDLNSYFRVKKKITSKIENRIIPHLVIKRTGSINRLISSKNEKLFDIQSPKGYTLSNQPMVNLKLLLSSVDPNLFITDKTGIQDRIDIFLSKDIDNNIAQANKELSVYGIMIEKVEEPLDVLIISSVNEQMEGVGNEQ